MRKASQITEKTHTPAISEMRGRNALQRQCNCGGSAGPAGECLDCNKKRKLQTKLLINEPGDKYEMEADRVADSVLGMSEADVRLREGNAPQVQRKESRDGGITAPPIVDNVLRSPGQPLDRATRAFMEPRFGHDFGRVRIHTDAEAAESARSVNARAYTVGNDIVFGAGEYSPHTDRGREILSHELTHAVQQGTAALRSSGGGSERAAFPQVNRISPLSLRRVPDAGTPATPTVSLGNFRSSGNTDAENTCAICPVTLGVDASSGSNKMEIRGDITGHVAGASYDIKRSKERATWKKVGATWTQLSHVGPGADDDSHNSDEDLTPENNHIFVIDAPGWPGAITNPTGDASAIEAVYKASFLETCNVKVGAGSWAKSSNSVEWHSITWLEKSGASWQRKAGSNEIATGSVTVGTGDP